MFDDLVNFILTHKGLVILFTVLNFAVAILVKNLIALYTDSRVSEAMGSRRRKESVYMRPAHSLKLRFGQYGKGKYGWELYRKASEKMKKSGYTGKAAPIIYTLVKYVGTPVLFAAALVLNYPDVLPAIAAAAISYFIPEAVVASNRKKVNIKLQKYMYKIYKYLHNQISSGVRVSDAISTVYEVIDDRMLRGILVRLAAYYDLTLDIDKALEEFSRNFHAHEAETMCVVLKQGIETGDNSELLARQESIMFKKYFNHIQAETDSCKTRCLISAVMFTAVIVLMMLVPILKDTSDALGKIFIN